jgi:hypothetical protein
MSPMMMSCSRRVDAEGEERYNADSIVSRRLLGPHPSAVKDIALAAPDLVVQTVPDAMETVDRSTRLIGYGYGSGYNDAERTPGIYDLA